MSYTATRRSLTVSISECTPEIEGKLMKAASKFKSHGLELYSEEMGDNPKGSDFRFSLGDKQDDEACEIAFLFGKAFEREKHKD